MTGRTSLLRRVRVLEDLEARRASPGTVTTPDIVRALELLEDGPLIRLEEAISAGRVGEGDTLGGPLALCVLALEEPQADPQEEEAAVWARAYLSGEGGPLPDLTEDAPDYFADRAAWCEEEATDLQDGEEKTRALDAAAVWAMLEALARVLLGE